MNNPQIKDKPKELSVSAQRMIAERNAKPAPDNMYERVNKIFYE